MRRLTSPFSIRRHFFCEIESNAFFSFEEHEEQREKEKEEEEKEEEEERERERERTERSASRRGSHWRSTSSRALSAGIIHHS